MNYIGSKNRIAKHLLPIMLAVRKPGQWWVEPFVGGANMIDKVTGPRLGNDTHGPLIALLTATRDGEIFPTDINKDLYYKIKARPQDYSEALYGFAGFLCSFGGKWWGGYLPNSGNKGCNRAGEGSRNLAKQAPNLAGVFLQCGSYLDLEIPANSLIYCDPPYAGTSRYMKTNPINYEQFWQWCRNKGESGHTVFVSEYSAPDDFVCVKEVAHRSILGLSKNSQRTERLFKYKG